MIYGDRGVGKSSIAAQIERIALGDQALLSTFGFENRALADGQAFATFYLSCTDSIRTKDELLQRFINMASGYRSMNDLPQQNSEGRVVEHKVNFKVYQSRVTTSYKANDRLAQFETLSVEEKFQECIEYISSEENRPVLVIIDELDRVASTAGLASFIKSTSGPSLKYVLIGVSQDVSDLLEDHNSLDRTLAPYHVGRMGDDELMTLIRLVERTLYDEGLPLVYNDDARRRLIAAADGFPWFIHILGQETLVRAHDTGKSEIDARQVEDAIQELAKNRYARQFSTQYLRAVGSSRPREAVLRLFAKWASTDIPTSEIYPVAHHLGIPNPSIYVRELTSARLGKVLTKAPYVSGHYSFSNAMFQRYVNLRSSVYIRLRERVDEAWAEIRQ
jgi:Cdc6-like AAA superfamily ATPase